MLIVVVGTGSIGMRHIAVLQRLGADVCAVPSRPERVQELSKMGLRALPSLDQALGEGADGVVVATDTGRHAADAERALTACPVLVEKPLATTFADARRLVAVARERGRALHVACCLRFNPGLAWLAERRQAVGDARLLDAECLSWLPDWRAGRDHLATYAARSGEGGVLLDLIHEIDLACWFGGPVHAVAGTLRNQGAVGLPAGVDETALFTAEHAGGIASTIRLSYATRPTTRRLRLWGSGGAAEWDAVGRRARILDPSGRELESTTWSDPAQMYEDQLLAWLDSLAGRPASRLVDGAQGAAEVAICDAVRRSSAASAARVAVEVA